MSVEILSCDDYKSSTITMVATLNKSMKTRYVAEYLPVIHLFNEKKERIKLDSGTRNGISFFGINEIIKCVFHSIVFKIARTIVFIAS